MQAILGIQNGAAADACSIYTARIYTKEPSVNARIPSPNPPAGARTTTVFTSGNSQAVRLPKEFRFKTQQVLIERRGDEIVLRERRQTVGEALAGLQALTPEQADALDRCMRVARELPALEEREWFGGAATGAALAQRAKQKRAAPRPEGRKAAR